MQNTHGSAPRRRVARPPRLHIPEPIRQALERAPSSAPCRPLHGRRSGKPQLRACPTVDHAAELLKAHALARGESPPRAEAGSPRASCIAGSRGRPRMPTVSRTLGVDFARQSGIAPQPPSLGSGAARVGDRRRPRAGVCRVRYDRPRSRRRPSGACRFDGGGELDALGFCARATAFRGRLSARGLPAVEIRSRGTADASRLQGLGDARGMGTTWTLPRRRLRARGHGPEYGHYVRHATRPTSAPSAAEVAGYLAELRAAIGRVGTPVTGAHPARPDAPSPAPRPSLNRDAERRYLAACEARQRAPGAAP